MESTRQVSEYSTEDENWMQKKQTRELLAFPWTGPNVQAKCKVMKAVTSISEKKAGHSLVKHAILPIRTSFFSIQKKHLLFTAAPQVEIIVL